jgi:small subunit ribosomal protein S7
MSRRAKPEKRVILPDPKYHNATLAKFINKLMLRGQKATAEIVIYDALDLMKENLKRDPIEALEQAIKNATPLLQVKSRRVGGATYQVPIEISPDRGTTLAIRWLIANCRGRSGKTMAQKLAAELGDAAQNQGATIKKREDTHKMAEANRAFAHFKW